MLFKKIRHPFLACLTLLGVISPLAWGQSPAAMSQTAWPGPVSMEPSIEKKGVRVALRTTLGKKDELSVLVKISNLSSQPILVSPDAVEASTEEGFIIQPMPFEKIKNSPSASLLKPLSKVAALIPFSDPYRIISSAKVVMNYAEKNKTAFSKTSVRKGLLHEVILQPGMATHGLIVYDASSLKAFDYAPTLLIKVTVGSEPYEFKFASKPR